MKTQTVVGVEKRKIMPKIRGKFLVKLSLSEVLFIVVYHLPSALKALFMLWTCDYHLDFGVSSGNFEFWVKNRGFCAVDILFFASLQPLDQDCGLEIYGHKTLSPAYNQVFMTLIEEKNDGSPLLFKNLLQSAHLPFMSDVPYRIDNDLFKDDKQTKVLKDAPTINICAVSVYAFGGETCLHSHLHTYTKPSEISLIVKAKSRITFTRTLQLYNNRVWGSPRLLYASRGGLVLFESEIDRWKLVFEVEVCLGKSPENYSIIKFPFSAT
uniref:Uncharacterized protein n=1 Tax=Strigamia maritima TaxID=126957 RepID=T1J6Y6_STRMM